MYCMHSDRITNFKVSCLVTEIVQNAEDQVLFKMYQPNNLILTGNVLIGLFSNMSRLTHQILKYEEKEICYCGIFFFFKCHRFGWSDYFFRKVCLFGSNLEITLDILQNNPLQEKNKTLSLQQFNTKRQPVPEGLCNSLKTQRDLNYSNRYKEINLSYIYKRLVLENLSVLYRAW